MSMTQNSRKARTGQTPRKLCWTGTVFGYITVSTEESAKKIAEILLTKNLIACANILPGMKSIFKWKGEIVHEEEVVLTVKTIESHTEEITSEVKKVHEYECPCIVFLPIIGGNEEFIQWVKGRGKR